MRGRWLLVLLTGGLILLAGRAIAASYADQLWFTALGAGAVWQQRFWLTLIVTGGSGLVAGAFVFANLYAVRLSVTAFVVPRRLANLEIGEEVPGSRLVPAAVLLAAGFGWLLALPSSAWQSLALLRQGLPFGETDPYFELDLSFFVHWLPFESALYFAALSTVMLTTLLVGVFYSLTPSLRWDGGRLRLSHYARRHLVTLAAILLALVAWSFRLDQYRPLFLGSGIDGSLSFTDHRAVIAAAGWLARLALVGAGVLLIFGWLNQLRLAAVTLAVIFVFGAGMRGIWPLLVRRAAGAPDVAAREAPYQSLRAQYSRRAYAVDRILPGEPWLSHPTPRSAAMAVSSWDPAVLLAAAARRAHGDAPGIGWSAPGGVLTAELPVRLPSTAGDSGGATWVLERLAAAGATFGDDSAPTLPDPVVEPNAPEGMLIRADSDGTIPAPALTTRWSRIAFGWSRQRLGLIAAVLPGPRPVAIVERDVRDRVGALAPFFAQGSTVTPLMAGGTLHWVVDLFSASAMYPLSRRDTLGDDEYSYVQHAATAIVEARSGRVWILRDAHADPIAASWERIFPQLFVESGELPAELLSALPPESDGARLQARMLARYGHRGESPPGGDLSPAYADSLPAAVRDGPYALPGMRGLAWSDAIVDSNDHVTGLVVATGGASRATYSLPLAHAGPRWSTITGELKGALDSALAPPPGTRAVRGAVRAVPIAGGILFTQSAFGKRPDGPPVVLRSAVNAGGAVSVGRSVAEALGAPPSGLDAAAMTPAAFRERTLALYAKMRAALARGDWAAFGAAFDALGALLRRGPRQP